VVATSLTVTNLVLFYRVLAADGLFGKSRSRPAEPIVNILPSQSAARLEDEAHEEVDFEDADEDENSSDSDVENGGKKRGGGGALTGGTHAGETSAVPMIAPETTTAAIHAV